MLRPAQCERRETAPHGCKEPSFLTFLGLLNSDLGLRGGGLSDAPPVVSRWPNSFYCRNTTEHIATCIHLFSCSVGLNVGPAHSRDDHSVHSQAFKRSEQVYGKIRNHNKTLRTECFQVAVLVSGCRPGPPGFRLKRKENPTHQNHGQLHSPSKLQTKLTKMVCGAGLDCRWPDPGPGWSFVHQNQSQYRSISPTEASAGRQDRAVSCPGAPAPEGPPKAPGSQCVNWLYII